MNNEDFFIFINKTLNGKREITILDDFLFYMELVRKHPEKMWEEK